MGKDVHEDSLVWNALLSVMENYHGRWSGAGVLYVDVLGFSRYDQQVGQERADETLRHIHRHLVIQSEQHPFTQKPIALHVWDDGFAMILPGRNRSLQETWSHRLVAELEQALNTAPQSGPPELHLRYGLAFYDDSFSVPESLSLIFALLTEAGRSARRADALPSRDAVLALQSLLASRQVTTLYQPIVDFDRRRTLGWESLARGPVETPIYQPEKLFRCAEQLGCLYELEKLCRHSAIHSAQGISDAYLFLNVHPRTFLDASFREGETRNVAAQAGLRPEQIVFEITEHQAVDDHRLFQRVLNHYRGQGYKIAIDDTGAGYSGLVTLMEMKPDFVKIDMALIRGIHLDKIKQDIVKAICMVSQGFGAMVVAEGIEMVEELQAVRACGVPCGQGYLFGHPELALKFPDGFGRTRPITSFPEAAGE